MNLDPQWIIAGCAVITLLILWSGTIIGAALWLMRKLNELEARLVANLDAKHEENNKKVAAMEALVMRHDLILDPEFNGSGKSRARQ